MTNVDAHLLDILMVLAHPDDESFGHAGLMKRGARDRGQDRIGVRHQGRSERDQ